MLKVQQKQEQHAAAIMSKGSGIHSEHNLIVVNIMLDLLVCDGTTGGGQIL